METIISLILTIIFFVLAIGSFSKANASKFWEVVAILCSAWMPFSFCWFLYTILG